MYPNLMGQKAYHRLTMDDMGEIIGLSRQSFEVKLKSGRFTAEECKKLCRRFNKSFDYLFATDEEINKNE